MLAHVFAEFVNFLAGVSGLITAYYWFKSSRIDVNPNTGLLPGFHFEPDRDYSATIDALRRVGELNKTAATWSAVSATLFAVAGLI